MNLTSQLIERGVYIQTLLQAAHRLIKPIEEPTGSYGEGRGPCIYLADGTRRWALESWFNVKRVYRGKVGGKSIYINTRVSPKINDVNVKLEVGRDYLVLLRPNEESMKVIKAGAYVPVWKALHGEEIIAIVEAK